MNPKCTVFYSWQSDLPDETNKVAIRQALREASNQIESDILEIRIDIDEATRNMAGSPNIPKSIFSKIESCDIFICDVTTINSTSTEIRKTPNPNVLIELGYAIASVGWDRIILLFNTIHGDFPNELPFDIDRHRATPFSIRDKRDTNGKRTISSTLRTAIKAIIEKNPLKPEELKKKSPEQTKRDIDIKNIKLALSNLHIPTIDHFLDVFPALIPTDISYYKNNYEYVIGSKTFHVYDENIKSLIKNLEKSLNIGLSYSKHYDRDETGMYWKYYIPMDEFPSQESEKDFNYLTEHKFVIESDIQNLLNYVRYNFIEIDTDEMSQIAFESYESFKNSNV